jgi:hypothetical protein
MFQMPAKLILILKLSFSVFFLILSLELEKDSRELLKLKCHVSTYHSGFLRIENYKKVFDSHQEMFCLPLNVIGSLIFQIFSNLHNLNLSQACCNHINYPSQC